MKSVAMALVGFLVVTPANAASFDCAKARTTVEHFICDNDDVSRLDQQLADRYKLALQDKENAANVRRAQRAWITARDKCLNADCVRSAYRMRIAQLLPASMPDGGQVSGTAPYVPIDVLAIHPAPVGKGYPTVLPPIDGDLVYSHYDDNGNTRSIVQFDFTNGHWTNLVSGKTDPALIAQDARYIVFHTPHSASFPITVTDRKTGAELARIRLAKRVQNAFIQGNRLVLFQGQTRIYGPDQAVAILALPSLKLVKETTLPGYSLIGIHGNHIYTAGQNEVMVYDGQFNLLGKITIPPPLQNLNMNCRPSIEEDGADRAVLVANCGEIHIVDLRTFSILHSIRRYAMFYSMALHDRLIFTAATDQSATSPLAAPVYHGIVVYDMDTGKQIGHLPIDALDIAIKGDILLATRKPVWTPQAASWPMQAYRINLAAIRAGDWQRARVARVCSDAAAELAHTRNLYGAIKACKAAGVEAYAESASIPPAVFSALRQYGLWLSQTLDKCDDAVRILEKVQAAKADPAVSHALAEARLKARVISSESPLTLTAAERQTDFGHIFENGNQVTTAITKTIDYGSFSNIFHFSGDRLYIGRWGCGTLPCDGRVTIGVFDRATLDQLDSIKIPGGGDDDDNAIESLVADSRHIYASATGRQDFFVIDRKTLKITRRAQTGTVGTLRFDAGKLLVCNCHFTEQQGCAILDPVTLKSTALQGKTCVQNEPDNNTVVALNSEDTNQKFVAVTRDYLVAQGDYTSRGGYVLYPRAGGKPITLPPGLNDALDWPATVEGNDIVIRQGKIEQTSTQRVKLVSLPSGTVQSLIGLPTTSSRFPVTLLHDHILYVGYGRDLLIYDIRNHRLLRYIKDFIVAGFKNNGFDLDANRIQRLIVDQGRLIVLTFYGANSRIILLRDLLQSQKA